MIGTDPNTPQPVVKSAIPAMLPPEKPKVYTNSQIDTAARATFPKMPSEIMSHVGDPAKIKFELGSYDDRDPGIAQTRPGMDATRVAKPDVFLSDPTQFTIHELLHRAKNSLPKEIQAKFAKTSDVNPYGGFEKPEGEEGIVARKGAKDYSIFNFSSEELGMIAQRYGSNQERIEEGLKKIQTLPPNSPEVLKITADITKRQKYLSTEKDILKDFDALFKSDKPKAKVAEVENSSVMVDGGNVETVTNPGNMTMFGSTQSAPAQVPQAQDVGGSFLSSFEKAFSQNQEALNKATIEAQKPLTGHGGEQPLSLQPRNNQSQGAPLDNRRVVGKHNAKMQGIGNAITGTLNALASVGTQLDNRESVKIADATHKLLVNQDAIDQARQIQAQYPDKNSPEYQQAQAMIDKNTANTNFILSDNKIRKAIGKGMSIDFTDPKAQYTLERKGVDQGKERFQKTKAEQAQNKPDYAGQFASGLPQKPVANQAAIARVQQLAAQQKTITEAYRAIAPVVSMGMRVNGAVTAAQIREIGDTARASQRADQAWQMLQTKLKAVAELQGQKHKFELSEIWNRQAAAEKTEKDVFDYKGTDKFELRAKVDEAQLKYTQAIDSATKTLDTLMQSRELVVKAGDKSGAAKDYDTQIQAVKDSIANLQMQKKSAYDSMVPILGLPSQGGASDGTRSTGVNPNSINSFTGDSTNLLNLLNEGDGFDYSGSGSGSSNIQ